MPLPIAGHLHRIDREHRVAGRQQGLHPRAPFGLDPDHHLGGLTGRVEMLGDQLVQHGDADQPLRQSPASQLPSGIIFDLDVVVGLGPVIADEQQLHPSVPPRHVRQHQGEPPAP